MAVARRDVTRSVPWSGLVRMLSSGFDRWPMLKQRSLVVLGWAAGALPGAVAFTSAFSPNEAAHGRPVQHGQTAQRAGLQAAAVAGHVCSVQSCDRLRRRRCPRWAGSRAGRASRCPQGTVQAWAPPRTCEPFDPTEKTGLVRRRRTLPFLFYKYAVGLHFIKRSKINADKIWIWITYAPLRLYVLKVSVRTLSIS